MAWKGGVYIVIDAPGVPGRAKRPRRDSIVRSTAKGRKAQEIWQPLFGATEARWVERFGGADIGEPRRSLLLVADQIEFDLPDCLPILGYGLFSGIAGYKRRRSVTGQSDFSGLPLPALLSKALLLFAIDYERDSDISLAIGANVLRLVGDEGTPLRDLPRQTGVSKEALAMSLSFLEKRRYASIKTVAGGRSKMLELTPKGREAREAYSRRVRSIEENWRGRFGADGLRSLRASLEKLTGAGDPSPLLRGIEPYPDGWRAARPKPESLPHFPMILYRGGFPDGS
jgi:DNA-binding MarR family transcriptional regulator